MGEQTETLEKRKQYQRAYPNIFKQINYQQQNYNLFSNNWAQQK